MSDPSDATRNHDPAAPDCVCGHPFFWHATVHKGGCIGRPGGPCGPDCEDVCAIYKCDCRTYVPQWLPAPSPSPRTEYVALAPMEHPEGKGCAHPGCLTPPMYELTSFYCTAHHPMLQPPTVTVSPASPRSPSATPDRAEAGENSATATDPGPNEIAGSPPPAECAHYWGDPALRCLLTDGHEGPHAWPEEAIARAREEGRQEGERDTLLAYRYGDGCRCAGGPFVRERPHSDKCRQWIAAMDRHGLLASRGTGGSK